MFIMSMNMLNLLSTCYIYNKKGLIISIPHSCLCGTSYLFWSNPRKNYIMYSDYLTVIFSIAYHFYNSFTYSKEVNTMYGILLLFYLYNISNYFKYLNKNEKDMIDFRCGFRKPSDKVKNLLSISSIICYFKINL